MLALTVAARLEDLQLVVNGLANAGCQVAEGVLPLNLENINTHWRTIAEIGVSQLFDTGEALARSALEQYRSMKIGIAR